MCIDYMQYYVILYKGLEHTQIWYLWRGPGTNLQQTLKDNYKFSC